MQIQAFAGKHIHFVGIGGVSMCSLAKFVRGWGCVVTGSDQTDGPVLDELRALDITCYIGHKAANAEGSDLLVYTAAVDNTNPEIAYALSNNIPLMSRGTLLGQLMERYPTAVGITGTHGKTTTSSMLSTILVLAEKNPTIHLGGVLPLIGSAGKMGGKDIFVTEACEYKDSFLMLHPTHSVILNIDNDHLDYFHNIDNIQKSFARYTSLHPANGYVLGNGEDARVREVLAGAPCKTETFGTVPGCDWEARDIGKQGGYHFFKLYYGGAYCADVSLHVPGRHNVMNAVAAIALAVRCGVPVGDAARYVGTYEGALRRMEKLGEVDSVCLYHDYAHHPTEVKATLAAMKDLAAGKVICVFQPHTYSRTLLLMDLWKNAFEAADKVLVLDIYAAREPDPGTVSGASLAKTVSECHPSCEYAPSFEEAARMARDAAEPGDIVITLGAGDITKFHAPFLAK